MEQTVSDRRATLDELAILNGTDKATRHPVKGHGYAPHYEKHFSPLRDLPIKFLEIGVGGGESIRTWLDYFTQAKVFGVDNVNSSNPWNTVKAETDPRYTFVTGDQSDETFWKCFAADYGTNWDVIVDDGGHFSHQIITSFNGLWKLVNPGGLYCIEDLACAYGTLFVPPNWPNHMDWLRQLIDSLMQPPTDIDSIYFANELAILRKAY